MSKEVTLSRSAVLDAPAAAVFAQLEDFHAWENWSPWEKVDADLNRTYRGPERGVGARYEWSGNRAAGAGSMEIVEASAGRQVAIDLRFSKPIRAANPTVFTLDPLGPGSTEVTWTMTSRRGLLMRLFARVAKLDAMLGAQFEEGLESLGRAARAEPGSGRR